MSKTTITITMESYFADKFIGFLQNLLAVNTDKKKPFQVDSVETFEDKDCEIVAVPKENS